MMGMLATRPGMTDCPCRTHDPGVLPPGLVASDDRLWGHSLKCEGLFVTWLSAPLARHVASTASTAPPREGGPLMNGLPDRTYAVYLSRDVGKDHHHACALDTTGKRLHDRTLPQDEQRIRELLTELSAHGDVLIVVDQPASIGALPVAVARSMNIQVLRHVSSIRGLNFGWRAVVKRFVKSLMVPPGHPLQCR